MSEAVKLKYVDLSNYWVEGIEAQFENEVCSFLKKNLLFLLELNAKVSIIYFNCLIVAIKK